mmetsp:Transcript_64804/g.164247  ORF Transcript_64804/g.164247 Transcript_64804/m.164247 type:complete len:226 (-) Transcript_64804:425-1102(-)
MRRNSLYTKRFCSNNIVGGAALVCQPTVAHPRLTPLRSQAARCRPTPLQTRRASDSALPRHSAPHPPHATGPPRAPAPMPCQRMLLCHPRGAAPREARRSNHRCRRRFCRRSQEQKRSQISRPALGPQWRSARQLETVALWPATTHQPQPQPRPRPRTRQRRWRQRPGEGHPTRDSAAQPPRRKPTPRRLPQCVSPLPPRPGRPRHADPSPAPPRFGTRWQRPSE